MDGLFCEKIFGPTKDWFCACGQYKNAYNMNRPCEKCGVDVTKSIVRRERMGHIKLQCPVVHINYLKNTPSTLSLLLDMPEKTLEKITYYSDYIVLDPKESDMEKYEVLTEKEYEDYCDNNPGGSIEVSTGAEAILSMLKELNLEEKIQNLQEKIKGKNNPKMVKQIDLIKNMIKNGIKPEWIVLTVIPVIPPDLRPMVQLNGGRFATSDINDLYRKLINRNNRLKKLIENDTPDLIIRNEKRMIQEAVDCLFNNGKRGKPATTMNNRPIKSLGVSLCGKKGRFRANLLGKRVDYSGRSVIIVGPELKMNQCGLPKVMAVELFKPYLMRGLKAKGLAPSYKVAGKMIERFDDKIWDILDEVIKNRPILLNRAPTLHRLSVQGFDIVLCDGEAIRLHPLVCAAFNADFDGDQMAVHLPLSNEAIKETYDLMYAPHNILNPKDGEVISVPSQDMVLGLYYLTIEKESDKVHIFIDKYEAEKAYEAGYISLHERIVVDNINGHRVVTTFGKIIFNSIFPEGFDFVNESLFEGAEDVERIQGLASSRNYKDPYGKKSSLKKILNRCYHTYGEEMTVNIIDNMKSLGFKYATIAGVSFGMDDIKVPKEKSQFLTEAEIKIDKINSLYEEGFLTEDERYSASVSLWQDTSDNLAQIMMKGFDRDNPIFMMADSGARGSVTQIKQLAGMRGLMTDTTGKVIEFPIKNNFKEGIGELYYFISSHGARKGGVDTALKTADSGYLTRRLVDVSSNVISREVDCHTEEYSEVAAIISDGSVIMSLYDRIVGRYAAEDIKDVDENVLVRKNELIDRNAAIKIDKMGFNSIKIRTILGCKCKHGVCRKCYGVDLSNWKPVEVGLAAGIVAAQSIGEPGTQLTMKTFHSGGVAGSDITMGLPRVEQLFEAKIPSAAAVISHIDGVVSITRENTGSMITVKNDEEKWSQFVPSILEIRCVEGQKVKRGDILTSGSLNLSESLEILGRNFTEQYIIKEIEKVYISEGVRIDTKHIEIIVRQMMRKYMITDSGDSDFLQGDIIDVEKLEDVNKDLESRNLRKIQATQKIMGIRKIALNVGSFLSEASFQETMRILTNASINGETDYLRGLKENIIIGALIPCGTGFAKDETKNNIPSDDCM